MKRLIARLLPLVLIAALLVPARQASGGPRTTAPTDADAVDLVMYTDTQPVLVRLHVREGDQPFAARWDGMLKHLFDYFDRNSDGVLDRAEAALVPTDPWRLADLPLSGPAPKGARFEDLDSDGDGKVTFAELADYYRRSGVTPFRALPGLDVAPEVNRRTDALFAALDRDHDGRLSMKELQDAPSLLRLDTNDDELVSIAEVLATLPPVMTVANRPRPFVSLVPVNKADRTSLRAVAAQIVQWYDRNKDGKLAPAEIGWSAERFAALDANRDGLLDVDEVLAWLGGRPAFEVVLRLGACKPGETALAVSEPGTAGVKATTGLVTLAQGAGEIGLAYTTTALLAARKYREAFDQAAGGRGQVEFALLDRGSPLRPLFALADRDGDGKLTRKELEEYLALQEEVARFPLTFTGVDLGRDLFALLDANKDRSLSVRELRTARMRLASLDRNGDGYVDRSEVPARFRLTMRQGLPPQFDPLSSIDVVASPKPPPRPRGPAWFYKMDRNGDGDVSRREFLGSAEDFRRIDTDGDGLISLEEALRADRWFRSGRTDNP
jgi:Ca2+-binding EF-hand superfamily protein